MPPGRIRPVGETCRRHSPLSGTPPAVAGVVLLPESLVLVELFRADVSGEQRVFLQICALRSIRLRDLQVANQHDPLRHLYVGLRGAVPEGAA